MKPLSQFLTIAILLPLALYSSNVIACDHFAIAEDTSPTDVERVKSNLYRDFPGIVIRKDAHYFCSCEKKSQITTYYSIFDVNDKFIAQISVDKDPFEANRLDMRAREVLQITPEEQEAIRQSSISLYEDIQEVNKEFGFYFYHPYASPIKDRFPNKEMQRLYLSIEDLRGENSYTSGIYLSYDFFLTSSPP